MVFGAALASRSQGQVLQAQADARVLAATWEGPQGGLRLDGRDSCPFKWHLSAVGPWQDG